MISRRNRIRYLMALIALLALYFAAYYFVKSEAALPFCNGMVNQGTVFGEPVGCRAP